MKTRSLRTSPSAPSAGKLTGTVTGMLIRTFAGIFISVALAGLAFAQAPAQTAPPSAAPGATKHPRPEPCWQVAGVSRAALQQRRTITEQARQQVEGVCANSSLSPQQKREQIKQIHQTERQEIEAVITPAQQEAIRSCQAERGHGGGGGGYMGGGGHGGPCGEVSTSPQKTAPPHSPASEDDDETTPNNSAKPN